MSEKFASADLTADQLSAIVAIVKRLGGPEKVPHFIRNELSASESNNSWWEKDDIIYFWVVSDGMTGEGWVDRLKDNGFEVESDVEGILRYSCKFKPTNLVVTKVAIIKSVLFDNENRITKTICSEANRRNLIEPNVELACLIREKFTDKEIEAMGLEYVAIMHEPVSFQFDYPPSHPGFGLKDSSKDLFIIKSSYHNGSRGRMGTMPCGSKSLWNSDYSFAFVASQFIY